VEAKRAGGMPPAPWRTGVLLLLFIAVCDGNEMAAPSVELSPSQAMVDIQALYKEVVVSTAERFAPEEQMVQLPDASRVQPSTEVPQQSSVPPLQESAPTQQQQQAQPQVPGVAAQPQPSQQVFQQVPKTLPSPVQAPAALQQPAAVSVPAKAPQVAQQTVATAKQPQLQAQQVAPIQAPAPAELTADEKAVQAQKQAGEKKVHQAQDFNTLVNQVNTVLDGAITQLKTDRKLFQKTAAGGKDRLSSITEKAQQAKLEAKGNHVLINAINTHVAIAKKENAKVFLAFATKFRHSAEKSFWKSYNEAKEKKATLLGLYDKITHHVGRAVKAMRKKWAPVEKKFLSTLKSYYKVRYGCGSKSEKEHKACATTKKEAKAKMKASHASFLEFKSNYKTAHHHGKKLRRSLKQAIHKLRFVFKQSRQEVRKSQDLFHAGFNQRYNARKSISLSALKEVHKQLQLREQAQHKKQNIKASATTSKQAQAEHAVNNAAKAMVTQAAKAIMKAKQKTKSSRVNALATSEKLAPSAPRKRAHSGVSDAKKVRKKVKAALDKAVEKKAEKKAVLLLKNVVKVRKKEKAAMDKVVEKKAEKKAVLLLKNVVKEAKKDDVPESDDLEESFLENVEGSFLEETDQVPSLSEIVLEAGPHRHDPYM